MVTSLLKHLTQTVSIRVKSDVHVSTHIPLGRYEKTSASSQTYTQNSYILKQSRTCSGISWRLNHYDSHTSRDQALGAPVGQ